MISAGEFRNGVTFEQDGFTTQFQLDSKLLTYKYKFKSL